MKKQGIGSHQSAKMATDIWLTPPEILNALGEFDLDPCSPMERPWATAKNHFNIYDDGLSKDWFGRVWLNPPYGLIAAQWLEKLKSHNNGIALVFARTETKMFFEHVWPAASSIFFFEGRLFFHHPDGIRAKANAGAPSVLIAYGDNNSDSISDSGLQGKHLPVNRMPIVVVGVSPSWVSVITIAVNRLNGSADLSEIYNMVEMVAPDKVTKNKYYKEKIRQKLQKSFDRISKGVYRRKVA